jgi:hypothetical protein
LELSAAALAGAPAGLVFTVAMEMVLSRRLLSESFCVEKPRPPRDASAF